MSDFHFNNKITGHNHTFKTKDSYLKQVEEFQKTFKAPVLPYPQLIDKQRAALRIKLIQEELDELKEAVDNDDLVEVADALCDLQYVLSGAVLEFGMGDKFDRMFEAVHQSNMSKVCKNYDEALATQAYYQEKGVETYHEEDDYENYLVFRKEDNKILKSINYHPVQLKSFIEPEWKCTDPDTDQWGRQISWAGFEFKTGDSEPVTIDLTQYTEEQKYKYLSAYYSGTHEQIKEELGDQYAWIVAECIYEMDHEGLIWIDQS